MLFRSLSWSSSSSSRRLLRGGAPRWCGNKRLKIFIPSLSSSSSSCSTGVHKFERRRLKSLGAQRLFSSASSSLSSSLHSSLPLPVIDLEAVARPASSSPSSEPSLEAEHNRIAKELLAASRDHGFFYIVNHGIPQHVFDDAYSRLNEFFELPLEEKMRCHVDNFDGFKGYTALFEQGGYGVDVTDLRFGQIEKTDGGEEEGEGEGDPTMDAKEVFHLGPELEPTDPRYHSLFFAKNNWPDYENKAEFKRAMEVYRLAVRELSDKMFPLFARALGLPPSYFDTLVDVGMDSMNSVHYPPLPARPKGQLGIGEHTDYECFTLLSQNGVSGLEILAETKGPEAEKHAEGKEGEGEGREEGQRGQGQLEWVKVPSLKGAFVVNIGDLMARWSDDTFKSTVHRAINHPSSHRYSIAYFRCCNFDTTIQSLVAASSSPSSSSSAGRDGDEKEENDDKDDYEGNYEGKYPPVQAGEHMVKRITEANANDVVSEGQA